jgi:hypothetical protein
MKTLIDTLERLAPPNWVLLLTAAALAAALLTAFVELLQGDARRREETRQAERVSAVRQTIITTADAMPRIQPPQLR